MILSFDGRSLNVDPATLTLTEREHRRKILADVYEPDPYDEVAATAWVVLRRTDQSVSFEDFRNRLTRGAIDAALESVGVEDDSPEA